MPNHIPILNFLCVPELRLTQSGNISNTYNSHSTRAVSRDLSSGGGNGPYFKKP